MWGHRQKSMSFSFPTKGCGGAGCGKGGSCGCGKGVKSRTRLGFFDRMHRCHTCGKSAAIGFGKGGCDCGGATISKGWSGGGIVEDSLIWEKSSPSTSIPHGQPTPAYDPPVELNIPTEPADSLPVPPTPTAHSASIRRLPPVAGFQY